MTLKFGITGITGGATVATFIAWFTEMQSNRNFKARKKRVHDHYLEATLLAINQVSRHIFECKNEILLQGLRLPAAEEKKTNWEYFQHNVDFIVRIADLLKEQNYRNADSANIVKYADELRTKLKSIYEKLEIFVEELKNQSMINDRPLFSNKDIMIVFDLITSLSSQDSFGCSKSFVEALKKFCKHFDFNMVLPSTENSALYYTLVTIFAFLQLKKEGEEHLSSKVDDECMQIIEKNFPKKKETK
jgi:hypothetical protein